MQSLVNTLNASRTALTASTRLFAVATKNLVVDSSSSSSSLLFFSSEGKKESPAPPVPGVKAPPPKYSTALPLDILQRRVEMRNSEPGLQEGDEIEFVNPPSSTGGEAPTWERDPRESGGPSGPEPTRYTDWERNGRCYDF